MTTRFCMQCGGEFIASVETCPDCGLALVEDRPPDQLDDEGGAPVQYELHEWAVESRVMLEQLLTAADVRHAWEGTDLIVPKALEVKVDDLIEQVEVTTLPTLDPDLPRVAYDIDDWSDAQLTELMHRLEQVGIAYEFDPEGALVVLEEDEERVEAVLDGVEFPDGTGEAEVDPEADGRPAASDESDESDEDDGDDEADEADGDADAEEDETDIGDADYDGPEAMDVMSDLFVAADRLTHKATDAEGVLSLVERAGDASRMPLPYGFEVVVWRDIVTQVGTLRDLLEDDDSEDDDIEEHARRLRDTLRQYV